MIGSSCLLDTGPLVALVSKNDEKHQQAGESFANIKAPLITCESVISEACFLTQSVKGGSQEIISLGLKGLYQIPLSLGECWSKVNFLFEKYRDQKMSFADASLIILAEYYELPNIFTFDSDFEVYRWGGKRKFEIIR